MQLLRCVANKAEMEIKKLQRGNRGKKHGRKSSARNTDRLIARSGFVRTQGDTWNMKMQIFDEFQRFPSNLHGNLTSLPSGWWSKPFVIRGMNVS